jgi:23S rRNA (cytosine1962-C5)-methyltransferase
MRTAPSVSVSSRGAQRIHGRHPWVYRSDLSRIDAAGGDTVRVLDARSRPLGMALYSERSQIALRMLTWGDQPAGLDLWRARIDRAVRYRETLGIDATAYRLVHGEGDLLPSLVVDRYGEHLVVQALSQGVDRMLADITAILVERLEPLGILARNDPKVRALEGLDQTVTVLHGDVPDHIGVREGPVRYEVDVRRGQKTGLFLDQRENREAAARYASGRLLDAFSYQGGFALRLAPQCDHALAIDISEDAVARVRDNAVLNGLGNVDARVGNVFDELRELARGDERFDMVVLDPPAFAKSKAALSKALGG